MSQNTAELEIKETRGDVRRRAMIEAATTVFLEHGFAATTLDKIIEKSGGSRRTLYEQFGNKEGLFSAVLCQCCENVMNSIDVESIYSQKPEEALISIGKTYLGAILDPVNLSLFRQAAAESSRFPEIGEIFYEQGLGFGLSRLAEYFQIKKDEGHFRLDDPYVAASQFFGMIKSDLHMRALFYPGYMATAQDMDTHITAAVRTFLAAYRSTHGHG